MVGRAPGWSESETHSTDLSCLVSVRVCAADSDCAIVRLGKLCVPLVLRNSGQGSVALALVSLLSRDQRLQLTLIVFYCSMKPICTHTWTTVRPPAVRKPSRDHRGLGLCAHRDREPGQNRYAAYATAAIRTKPTTILISSHA
jgi:hypothetical protein